MYKTEFKCLFCQNYDYGNYCVFQQVFYDTKKVLPEDTKVASGKIDSNIENERNLKSQLPGA